MHQSKCNQKVFLQLRPRLDTRLWRTPDKVHVQRLHSPRLEEVDCFVSGARRDSMYSRCSRPNVDDAGTPDLVLLRFRRADDIHEFPVANRPASHRDGWLQTGRDLHFPCHQPESYWDWQAVQPHSRTTSRRLERRDRLIQTRRRGFRPSLYAAMRVAAIGWFDGQQIRRYDDQP